MPKFFLTWTLLFFCAAGQAQTVDDIIAKYVAAIGGKEKLQTLSSIYMEGVSVGPNGMEITSQTYKVKNKLYRQEVDFGMGKLVNLITDQGGWFMSPRSSGAFEVMPAERWKAQQQEMDCTLPLVDYASKGYQAELLGTESLNGAMTYVIQLTPSSGSPSKYYIESASGWVVRMTTKGRMVMGGGGPGGGGRDGGEMDIQTDFSDYQQTPEGFWFPLSITRPGMGGRSLTTTIEKIMINPSVDPKLFKPEN